jgi:aminoglycoside 6'-N-acetyltransferase I
VIRPVEARDAAAWAAMRGRQWPHADAADLLREAQAFTTEPNEAIIAAAFIAEDDATQPLGYIEVSIREFADGCDSSPIPYVEGWYVEPFARRQGLARALMLAAETWARGRGFTELASDTEIFNDEGQSAHAACGFEETERVVNFRKLLGS